MIELETPGEITIKVGSQTMYYRGSVIRHKLEERHASAARKNNSEL